MDVWIGMGSMVARWRDLCLYVNLCSFVQGVCGGLCVVLSCVMFVRVEGKGGWRGGRCVCLLCICMFCVFV